MKTQVATTSICTYHQITHITAELQLMILGLFFAGDLFNEVVLTRKEIARQLGLETSTVSGRVNELMHADRLVQVGTKRCDVSGRIVGALSLNIAEAL